MAKAKVKKIDKILNDVRQSTIASRTMEGLGYFEAGKRLFWDYKEIPPTPSDEDANTPESFLFYGYMMARADAVTMIQHGLKEMKLSEKKYNKLMKKRVDALDVAHSPMGKSPMPVL